MFKIVALKTVLVFWHFSKYEKKTILVKKIENDYYNLLLKYIKKIMYPQQLNYEKTMVLKPN